MSGREEGHSIQGAMTLNAVEDLVYGRGSQCLFVRFSQRLDGAFLAVLVPLGVDRVVGTLVVKLVVTNGVEAVDDVRPHPRPSARRVMAATVGVGALVHFRVVDRPLLGVMDGFIRRESLRPTKSVHGLRSHGRRAAEWIGGIVHGERVSGAIHVGWRWAVEELKYIANGLR